MIMLAMLQDAFDGSGDHISRHVKDISRELDRFIPEDDMMLRLAESVEHGLRLLASSGSADDRFNTDACWALRRVRSEILRRWGHLTALRRRTNHRMHGSGGGRRFLKSKLTPAAP